MARESIKRVTEFVHEECGEGLRTVVKITADGWDGVYLREDLQAEYEHGTYELAVDAFRQNTRVAGENLDILPLGRRFASVHYHENAFVFEFQVPNGDTLLVSVEADVGRDLLEFIETCRKLIYEHP